MLDNKPTSDDDDATLRQREEDAYRAKRGEEKEITREAAGKTFRYVVRKIITWGITIVLCVAAIFGLSFYLEGEGSGGYIKQTVTDFRNCEITVPGVEAKITGTRSYTYQYKEYNGYRWYNKRDVTEETKLDIQGEAMTIIGTHLGGGAADTWVKNIENGERYPQLLQNRDRYTILYGAKRIPVTIDYRDMCK